MTIVSKFIPITIFITFILSTACEDQPKDPPKASFEVSSEFARTGEAIQFQNTSEGANTFEWDFGDGNSSNEENPSHTYTVTGTYTIHLEVTNAEGSDKASKGLLITLWTTKSPMPTGRWLHSLGVVDGKIYVIGGGSDYGKGALSTVEEYDPVTDNWSTKSEMPTARQGLTSSVVDGKIYVIGGGESPTAGSYGGTESYTTVEEYNPETDTWTTKSPMPTARLFHSASVVDGKVYIFGGSPAYPFTAITAIEVYNPATDTWIQKGNIPRPIITSGNALVDGKIYVMGGDLDGNGYRIDEYDPVMNTWNQKATMPTNRTDLACSVLDEKIYACGGDSGDDGEYFATVDVYDPATDTWTEGSPMIGPRIGLRSCTVDDKIYAIGGLNDRSLTGSKRLEVYYE